ncbi:hypothetical protein F4677DRAFT_465833 [Hypoxylon crocopeplum]|nr:hypothetical protein F4677DRAFT_465833 [Hypoxylon crocopeplum]
MLKVSLTESLLLLIAGGFMVLQVIAVTCYHLDGSLTGPSDSACDSSATGETGSHSACCNSDNADVCLSSGLCLNTVSKQPSHLLWSTGCTDSTFKDPNCPQYCHGLNFANPHLKPCNDSNFWCCEGDTTLTSKQCCDSAFKLTNNIGTVIAQLKSDVGPIPLATSTPSSSGSPDTTNTSSEVPSATTSSADNSTAAAASTAIPSGAVAGLVVEAVILALSLGALGFMLWRNRLLNQKVKEAEAATAAAKGEQEQMLQQQQQHQYQWQHPPSTYAETTPQMTGYSYASPVETEPPKRSELHSPGLGAYPELAGTEVGNELSSEPPKSPRTPLNQ